VPDLHGRLVVLDKTNTIISVLGINPDPATGRNYDVPQEKWVEGTFSGTHDSDWDKDGNLYVQDWRRQSLRPGLERLGPHHEAGARQAAVRSEVLDPAVRIAGRP
jgi:hypothetical protein